MKILYLHQYFVTPSMQGATRSYEIARRLVAWGHEVHMITSDTRPAPGQGGWRVTEEAGIHVHWFPVPYNNRMGFLRRMIAFIRFALSAALRASKIGGDLVFATSTPLTIALPGVFAARWLRIPMVFEIRDLWPEFPIQLGVLKSPFTIFAARWLERFAYRNSKHVIALSPRMAQGVTDTGYPKEQVTVIPNGSDLDLFQVGADVGKKFRAQNPWLGNRPLIAYTGSISPVTGCDYLVRLAEAVGKRNPLPCFVLIGEGRDVPRIRALAAERGVLEVNFWILPPIKKAEVPSVLAAADLAMATLMDLEVLWQSSSENKFFDALAAGVPICINYGGWLAEFLRESGAGLALAPHDIEAAADAMVKALADPAWMTNARAASLELARTHFSREHLVKNVEQILLSARTETAWVAEKA